MAEKRCMHNVTCCCRVMYDRIKTILNEGETDDA